MNPLDLLKLLAQAPQAKADSELPPSDGDLIEFVLKRHKQKQQQDQEFQDSEVHRVEKIEREPEDQEKRWRGRE